MTTSLQWWLRVSNHSVPERRSEDKYCIIQFSNPYWPGLKSVREEISLTYTRTKNVTYVTEIYYRKWVVKPVGIILHPIKSVKRTGGFKTGYG